MARAFEVNLRVAQGAALWAALLLLSACGVDGPPVPPGEENPDTARSVEEINPSGYF